MYVSDNHSLNVDSRWISCLYEALEWDNAAVGRVRWIFHHCRPSVNCPSWKGKATRSSVDLYMNTHLLCLSVHDLLALSNVFIVTIAVPLLHVISSEELAALLSGVPLDTVMYEYFSYINIDCQSSHRHRLYHTRSHNSVMYEHNVRVNAACHYWKRLFLSELLCSKKLTYADCAAVFKII